MRQLPAAMAHEEYIALRGKCPACAVPMKGHPSCEACAALAGPGHGNPLSDYRGHKICGHCLSAWKIAEKEAGNELGWKVFMNPIPRDTWGTKGGLND